MEHKHAAQRVAEEASAALAAAKARAVLATELDKKEEADGHQAEKQRIADEASAALAAAHARAEFAAAVAAKAAAAHSALVERVKEEAAAAVAAASAREQLLTALAAKQQGEAAAGGQPQATVDVASGAAAAATTTAADREAEAMRREEEKRQAEERSQAAAEQARQEVIRKQEEEEAKVRAEAKRVAAEKAAAEKAAEEKKRAEAAAEAQRRAEELRAKATQPLPSTDEERAAKVEELKKKGNGAYSAKQFQEAINYYTAAINLDDKNYVLFSNRCAAFVGLDLYEQALADADSCIRIKPDWAKGHGRRAGALFSLERFGEAVQAYKSALKFDPDNPTYLEGVHDSEAKILAMDAAKKKKLEQEEEERELKQQQAENIALKMKEDRKKARTDAAAAMAGTKTKADSSSHELTKSHSYWQNPTTYVLFGGVLAIAGFAFFRFGKEVVATTNKK